MRTEAVYQACRRAIAGMLPAMQAGDLETIERQTMKIRRLLHDCGPRENDGSERFRGEQLEAIEGLADRIYDSLCTMTEAARVELDRIQSTEPLLRHLAADLARLN